MTKKLLVVYSFFILAVCGILLLLAQHPIKAEMWFSLSEHHNTLHNYGGLQLSDNNDVKSSTDKAITNKVIKRAGTIHGTEHDDYIIGSEGDDTIVGKRGNDVIQALGGDDTVYASPGDDTIYGGDGNNQLFGEYGNDTIVGGPFNDIIVGGPGDDSLYGNTGDDILVGGPSADYFDCGDGIDTVIDYIPSQGDVVSSNCENVNTPRLPY